MARLRGFVSISLILYLNLVNYTKTEIAIADSAVPKVKEHNLLGTIKIPFEDPRTTFFDSGVDGFPAYGIIPGSDIKVPYRSFLPPKLYPEFSIVCTIAVKSYNGGFIFAVVNPLETVVEFGVQVHPVVGLNRMNISLLYTDIGKFSSSQIIGSFLIPYQVGKFIRFALQVTGDSIGLYHNCNKFETLYMKRDTSELLFDTASTLYIGQAGPIINGNLNQHQDHPVCKKKKRFRIQDTKKMNCPVVMKVTRIVYFPKVELKKDVSSFKRKKTKMMNEVRRVLQLSGDKNGELEGKERYYCTFSLPSNHNHPIMTAYLNQKLDPSIQEEIKKLVENGITNTYFVKAALKKFVSEMPNGNSIPRMSKAFYPSIKIISNYIAKFTLENRVSNIDQVALQSKVNKWEKNKSCSIFYRPHDTENDFLLCYQTTWQKQLLKTFGGITLLDATYKTVKYALPMFCIAVKTNVNYCIVGMFITLSESSEKIKEALEIFKSWNPDWNPEYFVVDYSEAEINAIKSAFGCYIYLCDFHREQSWGRWTKKRDNLDYASDEDEIMAIFRAFANCKSKSEFEEKIEDLKSNDVFIRNPKALRYFENTWLPVKEMWIRCFFPDEFVFKISTNNGIESQFKMLKYGYLKVRNVNTLSELMTLMIEEVFYDLLNKYTQKNSSLYHGYKLYNKEIPHFLQNRPKPFIKHVCKRYDTAEEYSYDSILFEGGKLKVRSKMNPLTLYEVDFTKPSCNCEDFWRYRLPCVHFCAAFLYLPHLLSFEDLPETYRNSPYITINKDFNLFENQPQCDWNAEAHSNYQSIECCTNTAELGSDNMTKNTNVFVEEVSSVNVNEKNQAQDDVENKKKEKKIRNIREICKMLIDKTYNMSYEHDKVQVIETLLQEVDVKMNELQSFEFLPLRSIENKKRGPGSQLRDLPKRKRLKKTKAAGENDASAIAMNLVMEEATPVLIESTLIDNILV